MAAGGGNFNGEGVAIRVKIVKNGEDEILITDKRFGKGQLISNLTDLLKIVGSRRGAFANGLKLAVQLSQMSLRREEGMK